MNTLSGPTSNYYNVNFNTFRTANIHQVQRSLRGHFNSYVFICIYKPETNRGTNSISTLLEIFTFLLRCDTLCCVILCLTSHRHVRNINPLAPPQQYNHHDFHENKTPATSNSIISAIQVRQPDIFQGNSSQVQICSLNFICDDTKVPAARERTVYLRFPERRPRHPKGGSNFLCVFL